MDIWSYKKEQNMEENISVKRIDGKMMENDLRCFGHTRKSATKYVS